MRPLKLVSFLLLAGAVGCGSKSSSTRAPAMSSAPAPPAGVKVLVHGTGDLDGRPGDESLDLYADGTLIAGGWSTKVALADTQADPSWAAIQAEAYGDDRESYFLGEQAVVRVELLDSKAGTRVVVVGLPIQEDEDPPNRWQVFAIDGNGLRRVLDVTGGGYGPGGLGFPGDNTVRKVDDVWTACEAAQHPVEAPIRETTYGWQGDQLVEVAKNPTGETQRCGELSACPWIYVDGPAGRTRVGEILRNMHGRAAYGLQALPLPLAAAGLLRVRIAEEENEVTFLDQIYVEIDGDQILPDRCAEAAPPAYCVADRVPVRMVFGDAIDLTFTLPTSATPTVFARGYYVPTPSRSTGR